MKRSVTDIVKKQHNLKSTSVSPTNRGIVLEKTLKLFFSLTIGIAGAVSLVKLVPYHNTQQLKLQELRAQVRETEVRVSKLRKELNRNFDPQQTQNLVEEYSPLTGSDRVHIFMKDKNQPQTE